MHIHLFYATHIHTNSRTCIHTDINAHKLHSCMTTVFISCVVNCKYKSIIQGCPNALFSKHKHKYTPILKLTFIKTNMHILQAQIEAHYAF